MSHVPEMCLIPKALVKQLDAYLQQVGTGPIPAGQVALMMQQLQALPGCHPSIARQCLIADASGGRIDWKQAGEEMIRGPVAVEDAEGTG
jgi:hypothetical protein